jgi:hypothetical protein
MDKSNPMTTGTSSACLIDQLNSLFIQSTQPSINIIGVKTNVVQPRPTLRKKASDRRVLAIGLKQLQDTLTNGEFGYTDALVSNNLNILKIKSKRISIDGQCRVKIFNSDSDVI